MGDLVMTWDPNKPSGSMFAPEVNAEIAAVAPQGVEAGAITQTELGTGSVTHAAIAAGAVESDSIAAGAVEGTNLAAGAVGTTNLADGAVTGAKAGTGVLKANNSLGSAIDMTAVPISDTDYAAIGTPDDNTLYLIYPA